MILGALNVAPTLQKQTPAVEREVAQRERCSVGSGVRTVSYLFGK